MIRSAETSEIAEASVIAVISEIEDASEMADSAVISGGYTKVYEYVQ